MRHLPIIVLAVSLLIIMSGCSPYSPDPASSPTPTAAVIPTAISTQFEAATQSQLGCTVQTKKDQPDPTLESLFPPPSDQDWTVGPQDASVTLLEYADFQCPSCAVIAASLSQLLEKYPEDLRITYRHFPLSAHDKSRLAAQAAEAAGLQGKFWEMHDQLLAQQEIWAGLDAPAFSSWLSENAALLELDINKFEADLNGDAIVKLVADAYEQNVAIGMPGTPFLVVNGEPYSGPLDFGNLDATIGLILLQKRQFTDCPVLTLDPQKQYFATLLTEKGDVSIELFAEKAPLAVNSFIFLARQGWFNGVTFHRVIPGFVAQAGDPSGTGFGGPGYAFVNEIDPNLTFDRPGLLAMANAGAGTNGSQFFITYSAVPRLNGGYTIFGNVISGMDVVESLAPRDPSQSMDLPPGDKILSVEIQEK